MIVSTDEGAYNSHNGTTKKRDRARRDEGSRGKILGTVAANVSVSFKAKRVGF